jgi:hypothetical protein
MLLIGTVMKSTTRISKVKFPKRRSAPNAVNGTVPPPRIENAKRRPREYLTVKEVGKLLDAARERGRYGHRNATMILVGYRHGLRVSELCALRWDQVDFERGMLHVRRVKNGTPSVHPLGGSEIRALRRLRREQSGSTRACFYFRGTAGRRRGVALPADRPQSVVIRYGVSKCNQRFVDPLARACTGGSWSSPQRISDTIHVAILTANSDTAHRTAVMIVVRERSACNFPSWLQRNLQRSAHPCHRLGKLRTRTALWDGSMGCSLSKINAFSVRCLFDGRSRAFPRSDFTEAC